MTVEELLSRISSAELTEWMARDLLPPAAPAGSAPTAPVLRPIRRLDYQRITTQLDAHFPPE